VGLGDADPRAARGGAQGPGGAARRGPELGPHRDLQDPDGVLRPALRRLAERWRRGLPPADSPPRAAGPVPAPADVEVVESTATELDDVGRLPAAAAASPDRDAEVDGDELDRDAEEVDAEDELQRRGLEALDDGGADLRSDDRAAGQQ
jgi:hypothetical protein